MQDQLSQADKHLAGEKSEFAVTWDEALMKQMDRLEFAIYHAEKPNPMIGNLNKVKV